MTRYIFIIFFAVVLISDSGCKKKSGFDATTKSQSDFVGTWQGNISTFKDNKLLSEKGKVVIYRESDENLSGIIFMGTTLVFHEFQFNNGTLYFKIPCNDPLNPNCQTWNLGGFAIFSEEGKIDLRISGNECGPFGSEYVDWHGTLAQKVVPADSVSYFSFAAKSNSWTYKTTLKNGDSCQVMKTISDNPSSNYYLGTFTQTCGGPAKTLKWSVAPAAFTVINDSAISLHTITFPIDAKPGVVYTNIIHADTTTVTLVDTNLLITTPAGTFNCFRFKYTEPVVSGPIKVKKIAWIWLSNHYGIIRQEVGNPVDSTSFKIQVLNGKSF